MPYKYPLDIVSSGCAILIHVFRSSVLAFLSLIPSSFDGKLCAQVLRYRMRLLIWFFRESNVQKKILSFAITPNKFDGQK